MIGLITYLAFFATMAGILGHRGSGAELQWGYTGLFNGGWSRFLAPGPMAP
jgi:branched-chain amino acid transport system permease protein